ncbi:MAG: MFS transporter [Armatimonadetes bacterium]|nr:MFS transporter [Armatimonadota bacterium]
MRQEQRWTRGHLLVLAVAWLGWTFDIMDAAIFNLAKQSMVTELLGGPVAYKAQGAGVEAGLLTALLVGWSLGGLVFGYLADRWGRVRTLALTVLLYSAFTGLTVLCKTVDQAMLVRFLTGLGIGGEWAAGAALVAESVPEGTRAKAASWLQTAAVAGPVLAALANYSVTGMGWRPLFLIGVAPAVLTVIVRVLIKEPERAAQQQHTHPLPKRVWGRMAVGLVLGTVGIATAQNVTFWLPNLVKNVSADVAPDVLQGRQSQATMVLHIGTLIGVFLVPWLCERIGRRPTLAVCFVLSPLLVALVAKGGTTYGTLLPLLPIMSIFSIGIGAAFALYFPELFPSRIRATGAGVAYNGSRIVASLFPLMTAALIQQGRGNVGAAITVTSAVLALGVFALVFAPETRNEPLSS